MAVHVPGVELIGDIGEQLKEVAAATGGDELARASQVDNLSEGAISVDADFQQGVAHQEPIAALDHLDGRSRRDERRSQRDDRT